MAKILVVDDEPDALEVLGFNLKNAGYEVTTADDGEAALKKARQQLPDLILLDLMLPEVDGLEVCKLLRRDPATSAIITPRRTTTEPNRNNIFLCQAK